MTYRLSSNFEVEVPKELRGKIGLNSGDEVAWIITGTSARLVRVPTYEEIRGSLKGYDVSGYRDEGDRV